MHWTFRRAGLIGYAILGPCALTALWCAARGGPRGFLLFRMPIFDAVCWATIMITGSAAAYFGLEGSWRARLLQTGVYTLFIEPVMVILGFWLVIAALFPSGS